MPPVRVLHVSDLHAGANEEREVESALRSLVEETEPDLVVATGDLTHRNGRVEHETAAALLRSLGPPVLAVPGNHDMPALPPRRFASTFAAFERVWGDTQPVHRSERLVAVGLNSARPWLYQEGVIRRSQLERVAGELARAPAGALRVVAVHHHLVSAPWRTAKLPVFRRDRVLAALLDAGADLVLSGHVHQSAVVERHEFEAAESPLRSAVVATAPGLGRPRALRKGEARGFHLHEADQDTLRVLTYAWSGRGWELVADRRFPRGPGPLSREG
jgi:3',5'-cyclic AMP phosphodiesterase CpdA